MARQCNDPQIPLTTNIQNYETQFHCRNLRDSLKRYENNNRGQYFNNKNIKRKLLAYPEVNFMQYLLMTSELGSEDTISEDTNFRLDLLSVWRNTDRFIGQLLKSLRNEPYVNPAYLKKPLSKTPLKCFGTTMDSSRMEIKKQKKYFQKIAADISKLYSRVASGKENIFIQDMSTQTKDYDIKRLSGGLVPKSESLIATYNGGESYPLETFDVMAYNQYE